ncbi:MAG: hypothetical protein JJU28_14270 [Cyclobacteriaceae bacterium]|nr:hypothetical protein [Cyclobacteriaceae bacterium]
MEINYYRITGRITDIRTGAGLKDVRIKIWDKYLVFEECLGECHSDGKGKYEILLLPDFDYTSLQDRNPEIFVELYLGRSLLFSNRFGKLLQLQEGLNLKNFEISISDQFRISPDNVITTTTYERQGRRLTA